MTENIDELKLIGCGSFRLKSRQLYGLAIARGIVLTIQDLAEKSGLTYVTAHKWVTKQNGITGINFLSLAMFLINGLKYSPEEVLNMKIGDILEYVPGEN